MKVPIKYLGKLVEIQWRDPKLDHAEGEIPGGWDSLAYQRDWGILAKLSKGVVTIIHCAGVTKKPEDIEKSIDYSSIAYTIVPECLIEKITMFEPAKRRKK